MMRIGYADPPYFGNGVRRYGRRHARASLYDSLAGHAKLIDRLCAEFPDGWAMSLSSVSLRLILPLCPSDVRVAAWVKPFCIYKPGVNPAYAWEPVIFRGGRKRLRREPTVRDWVSANITLKRGLCGAKPEAFALWLFELLGLRRGDEFVDLFKGSGAMRRAWARFKVKASC